MSGADLGLALGVFLACAVECVEALTITLAVGSTRGWRSTLAGAGTAIIALVLAVALLGPAIAQVPIDLLRVVTGVLMLYVGATWMRKAILRTAGLKAKHDEVAIYNEEAERAAAMPADSGFDAYAFVTAFKGVGLEGLEVAIIVLTLGAQNIGLASATAFAALTAVVLLGAVLYRPLSNVPENGMKFAVATMLLAFGVFWLSEGLGMQWAYGDAALVPLLAFVAIASLGIAEYLRGSNERLESTTGSKVGRHIGEGR